MGVGGCSGLLLCWDGRRLGVLLCFAFARVLEGGGGGGGPGLLQTWCCGASRGRTAASGPPSAAASPGGFGIEGKKDRSWAGGG